jgi:hypothetical protein
MIERSREKMETTLLVNLSLHSISHYASIDRGPGNIHRMQSFNNGIVKRLIVPAVRFAQVDAKQLGPAAVFLVGQFRPALFLLLRDLDDKGVLDLDHPHPSPFHIAWVEPLPLFPGIP